ncbi:hypothetical protein GMI69_08855 [Eggerthellaceae bacterium zg-887]|uniref:(Fe-S)-binding protein n=1 Tax=Xiamenia xianingshaonis TaxID=2682776 RepID=UPI001409DFB8|nr:(Fe-S)-binding protein [Xiamenia xianingshaonis]NHM16758.1 hypothetical protein [Xiamenia xianingshaonis]
MDEHAAYFNDVATACRRCGLCTTAQSESGCCQIDYADFARMMLDAIDRNEFQDVTDPVWSCTLCGACTARCPAHISAYEFIHRARCVLNPLQPSIVRRFAPMRTDLASSSFKQLRAAHKPAFPDALSEAGTCERLFFPGCSLSAYEPELSASAFAHLKATNRADGVSYECCGNPLYFMGDPVLLRQLAQSLADKLEAHGVTEIIVACPSCYSALLSYRDDGILSASVAITPLPVVLAQQGMRACPDALAKAGFDTVCVKDACRDRSSGVFAASVREILGETTIVELAHNRRSSRCCGSGGLVPLYDTDASDDKRWCVLQEFDDAEASCLVTLCANCSLALRQDGDTNIVHYLSFLWPSWRER